MKMRFIPPVGIGLCLLLVIGSVAVAAPQQDDEATRAVAEVAKTAQAVWTHGKSARTAVRNLRRGHRKAGVAMRVMARQLRRLPAPESPATQERIESDARAFVKAAEILLGMGLDAAPAIRAAATKSEDDRVIDLLDAIIRPAYDRLASTAMKPYLGQGTYLGMFDEYKNHAGPLASAFLRIFTNRDAQTDRRVLAGEGVAQLVDTKGTEATKRVIAKLHAMIDDADEDGRVKDKCITVLARLGDRKIFDGLVKERLDLIKAEQAKGVGGNPQVVLGALQQLITLHQESKENRKAAVFFAEFMQQVLRIPMAQLRPQGKQQIAIQCYNFACVLSRIGEIDFGLWALEESYNYGYDSWDWAMKDGDLANLRKDKRFQEILVAWKEGKKKPGSLQFDGAAFDAMVQKIMPKEKPAPKEEPKPDSTEPAGETPHTDGGPGVMGGSDAACSPSRTAAAPCDA